MRKIEMFARTKPAIAAELVFSNMGKAVLKNHNDYTCYLRNGSEINSYSLTSARGNRCKILIIDEAPEVKEDDMTAVAGPIKNYKRDICHQLGIKDFPSKTICITSACLKSNYFFTLFTNALQQMSHGDRSVFACALDYESAVRVGITDPDFFQKEREKMPEPKFMQEYGSMFLGEEANSFFPYDLTETCRTLKHIELAQPKGCTTPYVIAVDLATSAEKGADNAVITVIKLIDRDDGRYLKKVVYLRSFHGRRLDDLVEEVRKTFVAFPNTIKIVFDHRGLGDSFPEFMKQPWTDLDTGKEYPPFVCDDIPAGMIHNARPLLRSVKASAAINQKMASALRVSLEKKLISIPINSRSSELDTSGDEDGGGRISLIERMVYMEADALQIELGNVVARTTASGTYTYDTAKSTQHKDRYSSLAMAVMFIAEIEEERVRKLAFGRGAECIGLISSF